MSENDFLTVAAKFRCCSIFQTFALKNDVLLHFLFLKSFQSDFYWEGNEWNGIGSSHPMAVESPRQVASKVN